MRLTALRKTFAHILRSYARSNESTHGSAKGLRNDIPKIGLIVSFEHRNQKFISFSHHCWRSPATSRESFYFTHLHYARSVVKYSNELAENGEESIIDRKYRNYEITFLARLNQWAFVRHSNAPIYYRIDECWINSFPFNRVIASMPAKRLFMSFEVVSHPSIEWKSEIIWWRV